MRTPGWSREGRWRYWQFLGMKPLLYSGLALLGACVPVDDGRGHPSLLIITLDQSTEPRQVSPDQTALTEFIEASMFFPHVWHPNGSPDSVLASLLTGLHPQHHGVSSSNGELSASLPTLATAVYEQDVWTAGAVALGQGQLVAGLERGFERFSQAPANTPDQVAQIAMQWLEERADRGGGWLIWTHLGSAGTQASNTNSALQTLVTGVRELDRLDRTLILVMNISPAQTGPLHRGWAAVSLPRAIGGDSQVDLAYSDFTLLAIEHLSEPAWPQAASEPSGLDGVSPGLALYGLGTRRGPVVFRAPENDSLQPTVALFAGWSLDPDGTFKATTGEGPAPSMRVQAALDEALKAQ